MKKLSSFSPAQRLTLIALSGFAVQCAQEPMVDGPDAARRAVDVPSASTDLGEPLPDVTLEDTGIVGSRDVPNPPMEDTFVPVDSRCVPDCSGRACGADGCGGLCGTCPAGQSCNGTMCTAGPPMENCANYPFSAQTLLAERAGFGRAATGGDPARIYHVTTLSGDSTGNGSSGSLRRALESAERWWIVFDVNGTITFNTAVRIQSNKTIDGRGRNITLRGELRIQDQRNIIISDVRMTNDLTPACGQTGDVLLISGLGSNDPNAFTVRDIWINHVGFFHGGDGLLDIRGGSKITVSWSKFWEHKKASLMWRDRNQAETPGMYVTMHHNFFERITLRGPQFIFGRLHYYNNYQFEWFEYGAGCFGNGQMHSENNIYQARNACALQCQDQNPCGDNEFLPNFTRGLVDNWDTNGFGNIRSVGDSARNGAVITTRNPNAVFDPRMQYAYTPEPADDALIGRIRAGAGPRVMYCR